MIRRRDRRARHDPTTAAPAVTSDGDFQHGLGQSKTGVATIQSRRRRATVASTPPVTTPRGSHLDRRRALRKRHAGVRPTSDRHR
jgi:hypothetical protein